MCSSLYLLSISDSHYVGHLQCGFAVRKTNTEEADSPHVYHSLLNKWKTLEIFKKSQSWQYSSNPLVLKAIIASWLMDFLLDMKSQNSALKTAMQKKMYVCVIGGSIIAVF